MTATAPTVTAPRTALRPLMAFAAVAVLAGGMLLALSRLATPGEPFLLAAVYGTLLLPALVLARAERGPGGVRDLLRQAIQLSRPLWWLPVAGAAVPLATWALGAALGAARPVTWSTLVALVLDVVIGLVVINLAEELAWTGYFQSRAMTRWGVTGGSLVTAVFFTAIHAPLAVDPAGDVMASMTNIAILTAVAVGVRLLIGRLYNWTGGSVLAVALLHAAFNASEELLVAGHDGVRLAATLAIAIAAVTVGSRRTRDGRTERTITQPPRDASPALAQMPAWYRRGHHQGGRTPGAPC